jgi:hypothetical protein
MTTETDKETEKQEESEEEEKLKQFEQKIYKIETEQAFNYYVEIAKQIHDLAVEIVSEYINKNFKHEGEDIVLRKRAKLSNKWIILITNMYYEGIIEYDNEKKKFIINIQ